MMLLETLFIINIFSVSSFPYNISGPRARCSSGEIEYWTTEPWDFDTSQGIGGIGEGLIWRGCVQSTSDSNLPNLVTVDVNQRFQTMEGFGAALTLSSAWIINSHPQRQAIIDALFHPESGIGISHIRIPVGGMSDFMPNRDITTYVEDYDYSLNSFNICNSGDCDYFLGVLKSILAVNPSLKIMAVPWTAPGWMKYPFQDYETQNWLFGGKFDPGNSDLYARYLTKYIQGYAAEGITIHSMVPQNEPLFYADGYPSMFLEPQDEATLVSAMHREFSNNGISTKIYILGHNWAYGDYVRTILNDQSVRPYIAGVGYHSYEGDCSDPASIVSDYGVTTFFTEGATFQEDWNTPAWAPGDMSWWNRNIYQCQATKANSVAMLAWNLVLNEQFGPNMMNDFYGHNCPGNACGCEFCTGFIRTEGSSFVKRVDYWTNGHYAKFVKPGAVRVASTEQVGDITTVAYQNTDGSTVVVVGQNKWDGSQEVSLQINGRNYKFPALAQESMATFRLTP